MLERTLEEGDEGKALGPFETEEEKSAERFVFHDHQLLSNMRMKLMAFSTAFLLF